MQLEGKGVRQDGMEMTRDWSDLRHVHVASHIAVRTDTKSTHAP
jgi:hypothetical protein